MTMGKATDYFQCLVGRDKGLALESAFDQLDDMGWQMGEIAQGLVLDLASLSIGATQEVRLIGLATNNPGDCGYVARAAPNRHISICIHYYAPSVKPISGYILTLVFLRNPCLFLPKTAGEVWSKGGHKPNSLLKQKIAVRLTDWDTAKVGYIEADLVFHCGASTLGDHVCTVSATEISSGWWEGEPILGKSQDRCFRALKEIRQRCPFEWKGLDSDNGQEFINETLYKYCVREKLQFTRSRPCHKNDNAYIEEKNWTHVRKVLGYLRYDTVEEIAIIRDLYRNELRLYKNFFQPVMKLVSKERIGGRIKRKYGTPTTPYQNLIESKQLSKEAEEQLLRAYHPLNPAALKRNIDAKINKLIQTHEAKNATQGTSLHRHTKPRMVTPLVIQRQPVRRLPK